MKRIFFAAALAVIAIGGAMKASATTYWSAEGAGQQQFDCVANQHLCSAIDVDIYTTPTDQGAPVDKSSLGNVRFND